MRNVVVILAFVFVSSLAAQPLTVGIHVPEPAGTTNLTFVGAPVSYINLTEYAPAAGTLNKASVDWSVACSNAFKIVFLRTGFSTNSAFTVVATRGPFNAIAGRNDVTLTPPVSVLIGDLIGIVQLQPYNTCGSVRTMIYAGGAGYTLITVSDVSTAGAIGPSSNFGPGYRVSAVAYNSDPLLVRILPAAGALQGAGAFFRTGVQIYNPSGTAIAGKFVFHPQLQSASAGDPSLAFTLSSGQVQSYPDIITTMGTSGLGSLDVLTNGGAAPIVTARVFSDGGVAGTSGFSEEGVLPVDAIDAFRRGLLFTPDDVTNFRMNIGVRTLDAGATISATLLNASGAAISSRTKAYPANYFEQVSALTFTNASTLPAGGRIQIGLSFGGSAFIYSSIIDNRTSDSTFRMADVK
jgi:hypothetical protein